MSIILMSRKRLGNIVPWLVSTLKNSKKQELKLF